MLPQFNDRSAARLFMIGVGLMAGSCFCLVPVAFFLFRSVPMIGFAFLLALTGMGIFVYMLANGLLATKRAASVTEATVFEESKIIARFATNGIGETIFAEEYVDYEDPDTRLYIRLGTPDGKRWELKTSRQVWETCGEGMRGRSAIQGDWLASFTPIIGNP